MERIVFWAVDNQPKFFKCYFVVVLVLIAWSAFEGVFDIGGEVFVVGLLKDGNPVQEWRPFKAGYFTSLNYGLYYITFLPIFLKFVFETYRTARQLSHLERLTNASNEELIVQTAITHYSSKIVRFLQEKKSTLIFALLLAFFVTQNIVVEWNDYKKLSLGWVQGLRLKEEFPTKEITKSIPKKVFHYRRSDDLTEELRSFEQHTISKITFFSSRIPNLYEFIAFIIVAKLFFCIFTTIVFFYNINVLFGLAWFLAEKHKVILYRSKKFVETMDNLITNISVAGGCLTIFLFARYITNYKKGSFKAFDRTAGIFGNDQYIFVLGTIFIPITVAILFVYLIVSNSVISINSWSARRIFTLYIPSILFLFAFLIYLANMDYQMYSQLKFVMPALQWVNGIFM